MGSLVKMRTRVGAAYAMVIRLEVAEPALDGIGADLKIAEIEFAGEIGHGAGDGALLSARNLGLSDLGRSGLAGRRRGSAEDLCPPRGCDRADRLDPPGCRDPGLHSDRRVVHQKFQRHRQYRHRQILPGRRHSLRDAGPGAERAHRVARSARRICQRLWRTRGSAQPGKTVCISHTGCSTWTS